MTHPTPDVQPPAEPWVPPTQQPAAAPAPDTKGGKKKWLSVAGAVVVAGGLGIARFGGFGDPEVGDCVQMQGETSFGVVDCDSADAEYTIVGVEGEEMTWPEFEANDDVCSAFATWEVALWIGELETEPGTVYCAEPV